MTLANVLADLMTGFNGRVESGELTIDQVNSSRKLSTGIWEGGIVDSVWMKMRKLKTSQK